MSYSNPPIDLPIHPGKKNLIHFFWSSKYTFSVPVNCWLEFIFVLFFLEILMQWLSHTHTYTLHSSLFSQSALGLPFLFFILSGSFSACHVFIIIIILIIGYILWNLRRTLYTRDVKCISRHTLCVWIIIRRTLTHLATVCVYVWVSAKKTTAKFPNWDNKCAFNFNQKQWLMQTRSCFLNKKWVTEALRLYVCVCACISRVFGTLYAMRPCGLPRVARLLLVLLFFRFFSISFQRKDFHHHLSLSWCQIA